MADQFVVSRIDIWEADIGLTIMQFPGDIRSGRFHQAILSGR